MGFLACVSVLCLAECGGRGAARVNPFEIEKTYGDEAAGRFTVRVSRGSIRAADDLSLQLSARAPETSGVRFPDLGSSLGGFTVFSSEPENRRLSPEGTVTILRNYILEPFLPGSYEVPPLLVTFADGTAGRLFTVGSDPIPVEVTSALPAQLGEQDIEGMGRPGGMRSLMPFGIAAGAAALGAALAGFTAAGRRKARSVPDKPSTARETAMGELERLLAGSLWERGLHREFFQALGDIARRFAETRFQVHAPRRTTEEFLAEAARHDALSGHAPLLGEFLARCDRVKFARHVPDRGEVGEAVGACRSFLEAAGEGEARS